MQDKKIVIFDGVCNFCNYWVRFVFKRNKKQNIYFIPSEDEKAKLLAPSLELSKNSSVIYYDQGALYTQSTAALKILAELNKLCKFASIIGLLIPKFIRDRIYNFIARNRYKWFGKTEKCPIPSPELKKRFL